MQGELVSLSNAHSSYLILCSVLFNLLSPRLPAGRCHRESILIFLVIWWLLHETKKGKKPPVREKESDTQVWRYVETKGRKGAREKPHVAPTVEMSWRKVVIFSFLCPYLLLSALDFPARIHGLLFCAPISISSCLCMELMAHFSVFMNRGEMWLREPFPFAHQ